MQLKNQLEAFHIILFLEIRKSQFANWIFRYESEKKLD